MSCQKADPTAPKGPPRAPSPATKSGRSPRPSGGAPLFFKKNPTCSIFGVPKTPSSHAPYFFTYRFLFEDTQCPPNTSSSSSTWPSSPELSRAPSQVPLQPRSARSRHTPSVDSRPTRPSRYQKHGSSACFGTASRPRFGFGTSFATSPRRRPARSLEDARAGHDHHPQRIPRRRDV